jgi:hypothetical protein
LTASRGLPVSLSGLAFGEEHDEAMIVHSTTHSSLNYRKVAFSEISCPTRKGLFCKAKRMEHRYSAIFVKGWLPQKSRNYSLNL